MIAQKRIRRRPQHQRPQQERIFQSAELADPREDVYSLDDDHRVNAARSLVKSV
jgi:hypothetical protein